jgi:hypothetical protein
MRYEITREIERVEARLAELKARQKIWGQPPNSN